mmetsp:Transcript_2341/g.6397  ORF Transcript_2341/g.6397 Transcript_2341/m.6397 type:complete len:506 (+) Transcript_2341:129-1646(+)
MASATMASATSASQVESITMASAAWDAIGMELTIFAVTALCAVAVRMLTSKQQMPLKGYGKTPGFAKATPAAKTCPTTISDGAPWRSAGANQRRRPVLTVPARTASGRQSGVQDPSALVSIIDEVVSGIREQQSMKFASRVLVLYSEFQACMSAPGAPTLEQAARRSKHTPLEFYTAVVQCAVRTSRSGLVDGIIGDMVRFNVERSLHFYEVTMKQLAAQKQYRQALATYDRLKEDGLEPSVVTCSCLIGFAAEVGELSRAVEFFRTLSSITTPSIRAYMTVLRVHAKRQDWAASLAVFREMRERGVKRDSLVLNFVLATGVSADQVEEAAALVEEAQHEKPGILDVVSYNTVIKGYTQRGDAAGALEALAQMGSRGVAPNSITFNTAMDAAVRGGRVAEAWELLGSMRRAGLAPDKFTCSILAKSFAKGGCREYVPEVLGLLAEVGGSCDPGLISSLYASVLEAASPDAALLAEVFSQMRLQGVAPSSAAQQLMAGLGRTAKCT